MKTDQKSLTYFQHLMLLCFLLLYINSLSFAQSSIVDYVLYSGNGTVPGAISSVPGSAGYAVQLSSSTSVVGGHTGSRVLVRTTGNSNNSGSIISGGKIILSNNNVVV